ncbi:MAG: Rieske 2Fe-2S domain-containing protein [Parvibaculaceae bacterium]
MSSTATRQWHPVAASDDLPFRHVFHAQLLGHELALWRADDGYVNVWENRCLHRGVRLSIGVNDGRELKCQYHGWRYSNRTAGCTYIPAHPADAPARTITNRTFPAVERHGLVWIAPSRGEEAPDRFAALDAEGVLVLRAIPVNAPAELVAGSLRTYVFRPTACVTAADLAPRGGDASPVMSAETIDECSIALRSREEDAETVAVFFVQPVDSVRCVIRGVLNGQAGHVGRVAVLRHHNAGLSRLRDRVEADPRARLPRPRMQATFQLLPPELAGMPEPSADGRKASIRVQVARKWNSAKGVAGFELRPVKGILPTFQPGAHIDVHLPNGLVRQYSIVNGPGETAAYVVGVKLERDSRGGSRCMHEAVREGDVLAISEPRNNFPLRRDAVRTLLIAGGIGITPLIAMAQALHGQDLSFDLHYFARDASELAFAERTAPLGAAMSCHLGLEPDATAATLADILAGPLPGMHVYLCGPAPMLEAARAIAAEAGWPETSIHFEYFKNTRTIDDTSSFEISLARSCLTLQVPAGKTILEVVRDAGVVVPSSCEQGACGTCMVDVIEGEPDHQDVYLSPSEREAGAKIMTCVSRARSARLVLDL